MIKQFVDKLFAKGKETGLVEMEVYVSKDSEFEIGSFETEIDKYNISENIGMSLRAIYDGKVGYTYTENFDEEVIDFMIKDVMENATIADSESKEMIFEGSPEYQDIAEEESNILSVPVEDKIDFVINLDKKASKAHEKIEMVTSCIYGEGTSEVLIMNTKGLNLKKQDTMMYVYLGVSAKDGDEIQTGSSYKAYKNFDKSLVDKIVKEATDMAVNKLGSSSVKSNNYKVVLFNEVVCDLVDSFSGVFFADNVQQGVSLLKDKLGTKIADSKLTIVDDPFAKDSFIKSAFDDEGVATKTKKIIENGVLKTYFHNIKTAAKDNVESTGNGFKSGFKGSIKIQPTNMYVEKGNTTFDGLLENMQEGLLITEVEGLHAGLNAVTGNFSLSCRGFYIKDGKKEKAVNAITIASNFFDLINNIEEIGSDFMYSVPDGATCIGAPSLLVTGCTISGE